MSSDDAKVTVSTRSEATGPVTGRRYHLVLVGDLGTAGRLAGLTPTDADGFADLMRQARPQAAIALADPLGRGDDWELPLAFESLKAFEPAGLLGQVPAGRWRLGLREKLIARRRGEIGPDDLERTLRAAAAGDASLAWLLEPAAPTPSAQAPQPPAGGSILDFVDEPDDAARVAADVERLAAQAGDKERRISGDEARRIETLLARVDDELARITGAVLNHPDVRRLETVWRGVRFVIDRVDFRAGVRLAVLDAPRDEAVDRLAEHVILPAYDGAIETPGMVVFDYPVANTPVDLAMLDEAAQQAASLPVPIVFPVESAFFNIKGWRLLKNLPNLAGLTDSFAFAKWRSLRDQPHARCLVPVIGRFMLRPPWDGRRAGEGFAYRQAPGKISDLLWAHGHLAMGVCAARSFARHGWPTRMFGAEAGRIEDLPVVDNPNDPGNPWGPGDLVLPDRRLDEPPEIGMNLLLSVRGKDFCILLGGVSAARPVRRADAGPRQAALEISLPYQQFAAVVSDYLSRAVSELRGSSAEQIQQKLLFGLANLLGIREMGEMDAIQVGVAPHPDDPGRTLVQLRLAPPARIVPGGLHMEFGLTI